MEDNLVEEISSIEETKWWNEGRRRILSDIIRKIVEDKKTQIFLIQT